MAFLSNFCKTFVFFADKYTLLQNETDIHVLTGALKLFFRELPNPLFPFDLTKDFLNAISKKNFLIFFYFFPSILGGKFF